MMNTPVNNIWDRFGFEYDGLVVLVNFNHKKIKRFYGLLIGDISDVNVPQEIVDEIQFLFIIKLEKQI